jgi:hypothetical protein
MKSQRKIHEPDMRSDEMAVSDPGTRGMISLAAYNPMVLRMPPRVNVVPA